MTNQPKSEQMKVAGRAADEKSDNDFSASKSCSSADNDWIEIELLGDKGAPIRDEVCIIIDKHKKEYKCKTDSKGIVKLAKIPKGEYSITFPNLDENAWGVDPEK